MSVIIIDNYDSFTYNLYQMIQALTSLEVSVYRNDRIHFQDLMAQKPDRIILSPGPGHPQYDPDFGVCKDIIVNHTEASCPVLGVCLGHQGMAYHLGGKVIQAPQIYHGKTSLIEYRPTSKGISPLFAGMPNPFQAMRYHSLVVALDQFPDELEVTAVEPRQEIVMALQHREKPLYGVQFHPESIGTPEGETLLRNFLEKC